MKLNKLFHWLYASVMMLPLVVAPIFAIYSHRHQINDYTVIRSEPLQVNAKQYVFNGRPNNLQYWSLDNGDIDYFNNQIYVTNDDECSLCCYFDTLESNTHTYFVSFECNCDISGTGLDFDVNDSYGNGLNVSTDLSVPEIYDTFCFNFVNVNYELDNFTWYIYTYDSTVYYRFKNIMLFDLTDIFGTGNEPSAEVFKTYLNNDYYDYGYNTLNVGVHNVTYNDTDIGSQFIYDMYNCVDKYFNYDNVVNFGALYGWLNTTFFSGSAPLGFFIFWHLLEYWLLTSLLWLLFDVLIYVPMLVHRWLDKASLS